ncbi:hypothetical protein SAMN06295912_11858 [Sphingomonas laterariae]|uniref:DUF4136 domain-containing protein n=1 Tax=Edaphosphingomonas laterariae TaxID=861865 RepID=A0A239HQC2_9SPHN|nr:hypothetical protein [Sphingomonas laterariae]SNS83375.1 hypothetical protein SAMN06295912_11858 [Sphingomonas laterariae]
MKNWGAAVFLPAAAFALLVSAPAAAQEKTGNKAGFSIAPGTARIVLMRPSVKVGEQSTGGMFEPNADWTAQARENLGKAIAATQGRLGNIVVDYEEPNGADTAAVAEYRNLFSTVANSVITYQFFPGNRLPTKKRDDAFEWTLGPDIAALPGMAGNDYALFITTEDHYGSAGRKAAQIFAAFAGVSVPTGVHKGYAGLVDLKTGELVWLNADLKMGGDVRTAEGAQKRVEQLFEGFPGRTGIPQTVTAGN